MKRFGTGVVAGKFYPPHRGHKHLIDTALARCEHVVVLAVDTPGLAIPVERRAQWLREIHPAADVRVIPDIGKDDDSPAWGRHTIDVLGSAPDAVFSSEPYGVPWAEAMGCVHVAVDYDRKRFPVSGTKVRANPFAMWEFIEPCVRAHYAVRVAVVGAESTGTTTLAKALAGHYATVWVPEYGRLYSEGVCACLSHEWRSSEFVHIADQQARMEDELARASNRILICDTDPFATSIWHERYVGRPSEEVVAVADARRYDLYILTGDEIPFEQDGLRDGEHIRHAMHGRFEEALRESGRPHVVAHGTQEERLRISLKAIQPLLSYDDIVTQRQSAHEGRD